MLGATCVLICTEYLDLKRRARACAWGATGVFLTRKERERNDPQNAEMSREDLGLDESGPSLKVCFMFSFAWDIVTIP